MITKTETLHAGVFIASEANGERSRETATVKSGENLVVGEVVQLSGGKLVAADGSLDSAGDVVTAVVGIMFDAVDASSADVTGAVYMARDCEVVDADITYPTESTAGGEKVATVASLAALGIIAR